MQRDRLMSGTQHAGIDFRWLLANLDVKRVGRVQDDTSLSEVETLVLGPKAILAAEAYVLGLFQLYPSVYLHKTTRGVEKLFSELVFRAGALTRDGAHARLGLPGDHPLVAFLRDPNDLARFLRLDDAGIWGALPQMSAAPDAAVAELARRLLDRRFYKAIDATAITGEFGPEAGPREGAIRERLRESGLLAGADALPQVMFDVADRNPYKRRGQPGVGLDRIWVIASDGALRDLADESTVVGALKGNVPSRVEIRSAGVAV